MLILSVVSKSFYRNFIFGIVYILIVIFLILLNLAAPEVINFDPLSTATDMWSIGVITYIMLVDS